MLGKKLKIFNQKSKQGGKKEGQHPTKCITAVFCKERTEDLKGQKRQQHCQIRATDRPVEKGGDQHDWGGWEGNQGAV